MRLPRWPRLRRTNARTALLKAAELDAQQCRDSFSRLSALARTGSSDPRATSFREPHGRQRGGTSQRSPGWALVRDLSNKRTEEVHRGAPCPVQYS